MQGMDQCFGGTSACLVVAIPADKRKDQHVDHGGRDESDGPRSDVERQQEHSHKRDHAPVRLAASNPNAGV